MAAFTVKVAEREGFEPSVPRRGQRFSRPPRSTTPASLQSFEIKYQKSSQRYNNVLLPKYIFAGIC